MPALARWYVKTALGYLVLALLAGVALSVAPVVDRAPAAAAMRMTYVHLFVVGWLTQLIFGVAFWLFPRLSREQPHGRQGIVVASYVLLNAGLVLRAACEPWQVYHASAAAGAGLVVSAVAQWAAGLLFAAYIWRRVKRK